MPSKDRTQVCCVLDKRSPHCTILLRPLGSTSRTIVSNTHPTAPHFWGPCGAAEWLDLKDIARPHHALFLREARRLRRFPSLELGALDRGPRMKSLLHQFVRRAGRPSMLPPAPRSTPLAPRAASIAAGTPHNPTLQAGLWAPGLRSVPAGEPAPRFPGSRWSVSFAPKPKPQPNGKTVAPGKARGGACAGGAACGAPRRRKGRGQRPGCRKRPRASERR